MAVKWFQCKYCGRIVSKSAGVPVRTRCYRRPGGGLHTWVIYVRH